MVVVVVVDSLNFIENKRSNFPYLAYFLLLKGPASNFFLTTNLLVKNHSDRGPPGESSAKKILEKY